MAVKLSKGNLSGTAVPAGEAEEALAAALHDVAAPDSAPAVDAFIAALKQALKSLRTARGMTQGALAEAVGVSTSTVSRLEGDAATPIDLGTLCEVLQHLNVGLRCELQVDAPSLEVAVRPPTERAAASPPPADPLAIAEELGQIKYRIETIERSLTGAMTAEDVGFVTSKPDPKYRILGPEAHVWEAEIEKAVRAAIAAAGKKAGSSE